MSDVKRYKVMYAEVETDKYYDGHDLIECPTDMVLASDYDSLFSVKTNIERTEEWLRQERDSLLAQIASLREALRVADERVCAIISTIKPTSKHLAELLETTYGLRAALKQVTP